MGRGVSAEAAAIAREAQMRSEASGPHTSPM